MHFSVLQPAFNKAFSTASMFVNPKNAVSISGKVLVKTADSGGLEFYSYNGDDALSFMYRLTTGVQIEQEGQIVIPAKLVSEYLDRLPNDKLTVTLSNGVAAFKCGGNKTNFKTDNADLFPPAKRVTGKKVAFEVLSQQFDALIDTVIEGASNDEARIALTGVCFDVFQDHIVLATSNGYRLSVNRGTVRPITNELYPNYATAVRVLPPATSLKAFQRLLDDRNHELLMIEIDMNGMSIESENWRLYIATLDAKFPSYEPVLKSATEVTDESRSLEMDTERLVSALGGTNVFSVDDSNRVSFRFYPEPEINPADMLNEDYSRVGQIYSVSNERGNFTADIDNWVLEGESFEGSFDCRYLRASVSKLRDIDRVLLYSSDSPSRTPIVMRNPGVEYPVYVIMPISR